MILSMHALASRFRFADEATRAARSSLTLSISEILDRTQVTELKHITSAQLQSQLPPQMWQGSQCTSLHVCMDTSAPSSLVSTGEDTVHPFTRLLARVIAESCRSGKSGEQPREGDLYFNIASCAYN